MGSRTLPWYVHPYCIRAKRLLVFVVVSQLGLQGSSTESIQGGILVVSKEIVTGLAHLVCFPLPSTDRFLLIALGLTVIALLKSQDVCIVVICCDCTCKPVQDLGAIASIYIEHWTLAYLPFYTY